MNVMGQTSQPSNESLYSPFCNQPRVVESRSSRSLIDKLHWLTLTMSDISFVIGRLSQIHRETYAI